MTTKRTTHPKVRLGLYVNEIRDGDYYHVNANVVVIGPDAWDMRMIDAGDETRAPVPYDRIRNASTDDINGLYLQHVVVGSKGEASRSPRKLYGFDVRFRDVYSIDRHTAERMAKSLRIIEKRMDKQDETFGRAVTYGQYLARVAVAIKADSIVVMKGKSGGWSYSDSEHRIMSIEDGVAHVDWMIDKWVSELEAAKEAV